jgi:hypothetical protein
LLKEEGVNFKLVHVCTVTHLEKFKPSAVSDSVNGSRTLAGAPFETKNAPRLLGKVPQFRLELSLGIEVSCGGVVQFSCVFPSTRVEANRALA